jgi:hypothetical protein
VINLKPLQDDASKYGEPLKSVIEMQKDSMPEKDFIDFFIGLRKKARELDAQKKEVQK